MDNPRSIWDLTDAHGEQLFYPRNEHPGTTRLRKTREKLLELRAGQLRWGPPTEVDAALGHVERRLFVFEAIEDAAKLRACEYMLRDTQAKEKLERDLNHTATQAIERLLRRHSSGGREQDICHCEDCEFARVVLEF